MPEAVLGGTPTRWREWGGGGRRAVMLHCSLASSAAWNGVAQRLADRLHLHAPDLPGHGGSGEWDEARDFTDQALAMVLDLVGGVPVDLIGHSLGAVVCLRLALERPDLVRSLSLFEPVLFAAAGTPDEPSVAQADVAAALAAGDRAAALAAFLRRWGAGERWEELSADRRAALLSRFRLVPAGYPAIYEDCGGLLRPGRLEALDCPVLLLEGALSPPAIPAINATLAARLPNAERAAIPGAGHMGPITHPEPVARAIRRHLAL